MQPDRGVIFVATGTKYRSEALINVALSSPYLSNLKSCLITDKIISSESSVFDIVKYHPSPVFSYRDKISGLVDLPFEAVWHPSPFDPTLSL